MIFMVMRITLSGKTTESIEPSLNELGFNLDRNILHRNGRDGAQILYQWRTSYGTRNVVVAEFHNPTEVLTVYDPSGLPKEVKNYLNNFLRHNGAQTL